MTSNDVTHTRSCQAPAGSWAPITLGVVLRLVHLWMPVLGIHSWRQADTAAMARHFALSNTPIWLPQIDWGGASPGYVESEFPLFPFLTSQLYQLFGVHEWIGRGLSVICSGITIWLVIRLGRRWFNPAAGWWGGMALAVAPLGVHYGRAFQAESLLLLCAAVAIEAHSIWVERQADWAIALSWIAFTLAALIKVIPLLWLGLPLLIIQLTPSPQAKAENTRQVLLRFLHLLRNPYFWIYALTAVAATSAWYYHAYQLGEASGHTFGFWGSDSDRSNLGLVLNFTSWLDLGIRVGTRGFAIVGIPFFILGIIQSRKTGSGQIIIGGLIGLLLCTTATMRSSTVHEYYQLPLLIFGAPLIGIGWQSWSSEKKQWLNRIIPTLGLVISILVLSIDYWAIEARQQATWMPLALTIRRELPESARIVSITGADPTLLNLARRQGWIISSRELTSERVVQLKREGASHFAGSLNWHDTFTLMSEEQKKEITSLMKASPNLMSNTNSKTYLIPVKDIGYSSLNTSRSSSKPETLPKINFEK